MSDCRRMPQDAGHGAKWTRKHEAAIAGLLSQPTIAKAAAKAGIGERTLRGWLARPEFRQRFEQAKREVLDGAVRLIQGGCTTAAKSLRRICRREEPAGGITSGSGTIAPGI